MNIDDIDRKILKLLQENARVSLKTIAEKTFLSSPAVSARIEKLERDGIIAGESGETGVSHSGVYPSGCDAGG